MVDQEQLGLVLNERQSFVQIHYTHKGVVLDNVAEIAMLRFADGGAKAADRGQGAV